MTRPKGKDEDAVHLTLKSKFRVVSLENRDRSMETQGVFRGVTTIGSVDAIAIETEGGKIRVIPTHMVLAVDVLEAAPGEEAKDVGDVHYG